jgi:hypothetical protein
MKHADVRDNPDARVKLVVEAATDVLEDEKGNLSFEQGEGIFIWFEDKPALPAHVFMAAHAYWANFLHERGL